MKFSVITPTFRQLPLLKLCASSVADQAVEVEHIVQDGAMEEAVGAWGALVPGVKLYSEKDTGMYDAINRGLDRASGDVLAHLNSDEQYLPGALAKVAQYFETHPSVDVVFADVLILDGQFDYICSRRVALPSYYHSYSVGLRTFTAGTFFRKQAFDTHKLYFSTEWRSIADGLWIMKVLEKKLKLGLLRDYTSTFMDDRNNLALTSMSLDEVVRLRASTPLWVKALKPVWHLQQGFRRLCAGSFWPRAMDYSVYTLNSPGGRTSYRIDYPTSNWRTRKS